MLSRKLGLWFGVEHPATHLRDVEEMNQMTYSKNGPYCRLTIVLHNDIILP